MLKRKGVERPQPMKPSGWKHVDALYGEWELPQILYEMMQTRFMERLRGISMGVMPYTDYDWVTLPNRCIHGLGVARLMADVIEANPTLEEDAPTFLATEFAHDGGSIPCSHGPEPFLWDGHQHNCESLLPVMIDYFSPLLDPRSMKKVLTRNQILIERIMDGVLGRTALGRIIHGDIDLDNMDNLARFWCAAYPLRPLPFDPRELARSFVWNGKEWRLLGSAWSHIRGWRQARLEIYNRIQELPHFAVNAMFQRAIYFAHREKELTMENFYTKNDLDGIAHLGDNCNEKSRLLVRLVRSWDWYVEIVKFEFEATVPILLQPYLERTLGPYELADEIACHAGLAPMQVCVSLFRGNDRREISLSFTDGTPIKNHLPVHREHYFLKVFAPRGLSEISKQKIREAISTYIA